MAQCILKNDFWCKSLSFNQTKDIHKKYYKKLENGEDIYIKPSIKHLYEHFDEL